MSITYEKTENGNLKFKADEESRQEIQAILSDSTQGYPKALDYLIEQVCGNGLEFIRPEQIGALTDAPIFAEDVSYNDNGEIEETGSVYWFPNYAVTDELEQLASTGETIFNHAPEIERTNSPSPGP